MHHNTQHNSVFSAVHHQYSHRNKFTSGKRHKECLFPFKENIKCTYIFKWHYFWFNVLIYFWIWFSWGIRNPNKMKKSFYMLELPVYTKWNNLKLQTIKIFKATLSSKLFKVLGYSHVFRKVKCQQHLLLPFFLCCFFLTITAVVYQWY